jgi:hypothetical protein
MRPAAMQPTVALGMLLLGQCLLGASVLGLWRQTPEASVSAYAQGPLCAQPVAVVGPYGPLLACADAPDLVACGARALDCIWPTAQGCRRLPDGMPQRWRVPLGLPLDINRANLIDLQTLPEVGPATAAAIVQTRTHLGRFATPDALRAVAGLGPLRLARLRSLVATPD